MARQSDANLFDGETQIELLFRFIDAEADKIRKRKDIGDEEASLLDFIEDMLKQSITPFWYIISNLENKLFTVNLLSRKIRNWRRPTM